MITAGVATRHRETFAFLAGSFRAPGCQASEKTIRPNVPRLWLWDLRARAVIGDWCGYVAMRAGSGDQGGLVRREGVNVAGLRRCRLDGRRLHRAAVLAGNGR